MDHPVTGRMSEWIAKFDPCSDFLQFMEERVPYYVFVDSLKPIELLVCFSALVRWGESGGKRVLRVEYLDVQSTGGLRTM